jgi:hypothetical protein
MLFSGLSLNSSEWLALRGMLFGKTVGGFESTATFGDILASGGDVNDYRERYILPKDFMTPFYCGSCDKDFTSLTTPTHCPHCGAQPGEQAITLTHHGKISGCTITMKTFPFFVPEKP